MKFILTFLMCSFIDGKTTCLPPFQSEVEYVDAYNCMLDGYTEAYNKIVEIGREDVNQYRIYIKFGCHENQSNKTTVSSIEIR